MTKYEDGEFLELMPSLFKEKADVAAISYAYKMAVASLLMSQKRTYLLSDIDNMSEEVLDLTALELNAPYYSEDLDIDTKRSLVKNAVIWESKAGTKKAVQDLIKTLFGYGEIVEWFDFTHGEQTPGLFDIETEAELTPEVYEQLAKTIENVKNESSHMRYVSFIRELNTQFAARFGRFISSSQTVTNDTVIDDPDQAMFLDEFYAMAEDSYFITDEVIDVPEIQQDESTTHYAAMGIVQHSSQYIGGV